MEGFLEQGVVRAYFPFLEERIYSVDGHRKYFQGRTSAVQILRHFKSVFIQPDHVG